MWITHAVRADPQIQFHVKPVLSTCCAPIRVPVRFSTIWGVTGTWAIRWSRRNPVELDHAVELWSASTSRHSVGRLLVVSRSGRHRVGVAPFHVKRGARRSGRPIDEQEELAHPPPYCPSLAGAQSLRVCHSSASRCQPV